MVSNIKRRMISLMFGQYLLIRIYILIGVTEKSEKLETFG